MSINFYKKILGLVLKKGKKSLFNLILNKSFNFLQRTLKLSFSYLLNTLYIALSTFVESKTIKIKRRLYTIPFPISINRRIYLIGKWLLLSIAANKKKISFSKKLIEEIMLIVQNQTSKALIFKKDNILKSLSNRSNAHFRW
jgi:ribosomal protein S7